MAKFKTYKLEVDEIRDKPKEGEWVGYLRGHTIKLLLFGIIPVMSFEISEYDRKKLFG